MPTFISNMHIINTKLRQEICRTLPQLMQGPVYYQFPIARQHQAIFHQKKKKATTLYFPG